MRRLITGAFALVAVGTGLFFGSARYSAAAPGSGFTDADFKGAYVGHYNGGTAGAPSGGFIRLVASGAGGLNVSLIDARGSATLTVDVACHVAPDGSVSLDGQFGEISLLSGMLSDRGKRLDFVIRASIPDDVSAAGAANVQ